MAYLLNVKNALLNQDLQEDIYMTPPPGVLNDYEYVCKLKNVIWSQTSTSY